MSSDTLETFIKWFLEKGLLFNEDLDYPSSRKSVSVIEDSSQLSFNWKNQSPRRKKKLYTNTLIPFPAQSVKLTMLRLVVSTWMGDYQSSK